MVVCGVVFFLNRDGGKAITPDYRIFLATDSVDGSPAIENMDLDDARDDHEPGWLIIQEEGHGATSTCATRGYEWDVWIKRMVV